MSATQPIQHSDGLDGAEIVIVGGGFGGLSAACYLAQAGADVTVLEKNEQFGGRASTFERDGFQFDMGPSWYLMPDVFERFFGHFEKSPSDYYDLRQLDPHYRVFWKDGDRVDVSPNLDQNKRMFDSFEANAGATLETYLEDAATNYSIAMDQFVYKDRSSWRDFLDFDLVRHARGLSLLGSMQDHVERYFSDPKLQQLMQYSLVFLGGAPRKTPALYNLMSHVDFNLGVHYPTGGISSVVDGLVDLGREQGVTFVTDVPVTEITPADGFSIRTDDGRSFRADRVISNADYAHTELDLLTETNRQYDREYWESRTLAPSAYLLYLGIEGSVDPLAHHTLVLPTDWSEHFDEIFETPQWPSDPSYYICVPSQTDTTVAPEGDSSLFVLVPIAAGLADGPERRQQFRDLILADIARSTGVDLRDRIVLERSFCVEEFADRYNSYQGSALGLAHTLRQTSLLRPRRQSRACDGLYFTGSYTNPGIGMPMCLISGQHTAQAVANGQ